MDFGYLCDLEQDTCFFFLSLYASRLTLDMQKYNEPLSKIKNADV